MSRLPVKPYSERNADDQTDQQSDDQANQTGDVWQENLSSQSSVISRQTGFFWLLTTGY